MTTQKGSPSNDAQDVAFILPLSDSSAHLLQVGGKGASLARLSEAGLPVPQGFHIVTGAYQRFVAENGLQEKILEAVSAASADDPRRLAKQRDASASFLPRARCQLTFPQL